MPKVLVVVKNDNQTISYLALKATPLAYSMKALRAINKLQQM
jgi:hypothetical protein